LKHKEITKEALDRLYRTFIGEVNVNALDKHDRLDLHDLKKHIKDFVHSIYRHSARDVRRLLHSAMLELKHKEVSKETLDRLYHTFIGEVNVNALDKHDRLDIHDLKKHVKDFIHSIYRHSARDVRRLLHSTILELKHKEITKETLDRLYHTFIGEVNVNALDKHDRLDIHDLKKHIKHFVNTVYRHSERHIRKLLLSTMLELKHKEVTKEMLDKIYHTFIKEINVNVLDVHDLDQHAQHFVHKLFQHSNKINKINHAIEKKTRKIDALKEQEHGIPENVKRHIDEKINQLRTQISHDNEYLKHVLEKIAPDHAKKHKHAVTTHKHKHDRDQSSIRKLIQGNVWKLKKQKIDKKTLENIFAAFNKEIETKGLDLHELHQAVEDFVARIEKIEKKAPKHRKNRD